MTEPQWLTWSRELQGIAQTGLAFVRDPYDRERYEMLRDLASRIMIAHSSVSAVPITALFEGEAGYATPKTDVRGAAFDAKDRILLVREVADEGRWTLPGGWADINLTGAEDVVKEMREESGFDVRVRKRAAELDRTRQGHTPKVFSAHKLFFICDIIGGTATTGPKNLGNRLVRGQRAAARYLGGPGSAGADPADVRASSGCRVGDGFRLERDRQRWNHTRA